MNAIEERIRRNQVAEVAAQINSSLMPDNKQWTNRFTVESQTSDKIYTVAQRRTDSVWGCSCRGWINHKHCKHVTDILGRLAAVKVDAAVDVEVLALLDSARTAYLDLDDAVVVHSSADAGPMLNL